MLDVVRSEATVSLKQQGEAALGRSVYAVLERGCLLWIVSREEYSCSPQAEWA